MIFGWLNLMPDKSLLSTFFPAHLEGAAHMSGDRSSLIMFYVLSHGKGPCGCNNADFLIMSSQLMLKTSRAPALLENNFFPRKENQQRNVRLVQISTAEKWSVRTRFAALLNREIQNVPTSARYCLVF